MISAGEAARTPGVVEVPPANTPTALIMTWNAANPDTHFIIHSPIGRFELVMATRARSDSCEARPSNRHGKELTAPSANSGRNLVAAPPKSMLHVTAHFIFPAPLAN
jgi:hypothetical protein